MKTIYTIGYSTRTPCEVKSILEKYGIKNVVDVRSFPYSKRNPQFNREKIKEYLYDNGFVYTWCGSELGGKQDIDEVIMCNMLEIILKNNENNTVLMCAKKDHTKCHRHYKLEKIINSIDKNIEVLHIGEDYQIVDYLFDSIGRNL